MFIECIKGKINSFNFQKLVRKCYIFNYHYSVFLQINVDIKLPALI